MVYSTTSILEVVEYILKCIELFINNILLYLFCLGKESAFCLNLQQ